MRRHVVGDGDLVVLLHLVFPVRTVQVDIACPSDMHMGGDVFRPLAVGGGQE